MEQESLSSSINEHRTTSPTTSATGEPTSRNIHPPSPSASFTRTSATADEPHPPVTPTKPKRRLALPSYLPLLIFAALHITYLVLFTVYRNTIIPYLHTFGTQVQQQGFGGAVIVTLIIFCASFPPIPGFALYNTLSGLIYGWLGIVPAIVGGFAGAVVSFLVFRRFGQRYIRKFILAHPRLAAVVRAVESEGFMLFFLIRFAPYPWELVNVLFASTNTSLLRFSLVTLAVTPKFLIDVYIGANLTVLTDSLLDHPSVTTWALFMLGVVVAVGVVVYIGWIGRREIRRMEQLRAVGWTEEDDAGAEKGVNDEEGLEDEEGWEDMEEGAETVEKDGLGV